MKSALIYEIDEYESIKKRGTLYYMPFDKLEEILEKYSNNCIDKNNNVVISEECNRLLLYLQRNMLPKSRNEKLSDCKSENKK